MKYYNDYLDYFIKIIKDKNIYPVDILIEDMEKYKKVGYDKQNLEKINIFHAHVFRNKNIHLVNYFNYERCRENNKPIPFIDYEPD